MKTTSTSFKTSTRFPYDKTIETTTVETPTTLGQKYEPAKSYGSGNSQLLNDYQAALMTAYSLGEEIKDLYNIIPPKILAEAVGKNIHGNYNYISGSEVVVSLVVN